MSSTPKNIFELKKKKRRKEVLAAGKLDLAGGAGGERKKFMGFNVQRVTKKSEWERN